MYSRLHDKFIRALNIGIITEVDGFVVITSCNLSNDILIKYLVVVQHKQTNASDHGYNRIAYNQCSLIHFLIYFLHFYEQFCRSQINCNILGKQKMQVYI